jgi:hypothetical protein
MKTIATILLLLAAVTSASAAVSEGSFPVNLSISTSVCSLLPADLSGIGTGHFVARTIVTDNGLAHMGSMINIHGTATDANGNRYVFNHTDTFETVSGGTSPSITTSTEKFSLIGLDGAPNVTLYATFHTTALPDGTVTASVDRVSGAEGCFPG